MKKTILVLSYVFGGLAILTLIGVFLYYNVWMGSFRYMEPDSDTGYYQHNNMVYNNGTLAVMDSDDTDIKVDIITPSSKKSVDCTSEEYIELLKYRYSIDLKDNTVYVVAENGNRASNFPVEDIAVNTDTIDENIEVYLLSADSAGLFRYKLYVNNEDVYYLGVDENAKYLYVEYFVNEDITTAYYYRYDLATSKLADVHTVEFCDNVTQGISVVRDIYHCERMAVGDYVFYEFAYRNYLKSKLYRHNIKSGETVVVGEFQNRIFTANNSTIFYTMVGTEEWFDSAESGIWKMDADTLETTLVTTEYYDRMLLCTENYIYAYKNLDIVIPPLPSYDTIVIERGYDVKQISIKGE